MAMLEAAHRWDTDGSSGGLAAYEVACGGISAAMYLQCSTIASTYNIEFQTGLSSAGPWVTEASTSASATNLVTSLDVLRVSGPFQWVRPYFRVKSTGTHIVRLFVVG